MTRSRGKLIAASGVLGAVVIAGSAFVLTHDQSRERSDCRVQVFFRPTASSRQIQAVGDRLAAIEHVSSSFVSKEEALEIMRRKYPEVVKNIGGNPLPDSYSARTMYAKACFELVDSVRPRPAGVERVSSSVHAGEEAD